MAAKLRRQKNLLKKNATKDALKAVGKEFLVVAPLIAELTTVGKAYRTGKAIIASEKALSKTLKAVGKELLDARRRKRVTSNGKKLGSGGSAKPNKPPKFD